LYGVGPPPVLSVRSSSVQLMALDCPPTCVEIRPAPENIMRQIFVIAVLASTLMAAGCNTVAGVGKDMSSAGKAVTGTANDVKK
jgi:entericidin B